MVTIRDIAKAAGVSPMTVSHVVNNHPHVRESTRTRVLQAMDDLDYRVNLAARSLRTGRTRTIGLAVPEVDRPYFGELGAAVIHYGRQHGLQVVIEQTRSRENELAALAHSRLMMYDGLILSTVELGGADADLLRVDFPVVILGERIFSGPVDHIGLPNVDGAHAAVSHLIAQGARRIAMLRGGDSGEVDVSSLRHEGYARALREHGLEVDDSLAMIMDDFTPAEAIVAVERALAAGARFDGLFCITDYAGIGALRALASAGIRVPQDVKVIGFDDIELAAYTVPTLSSVSPDSDAVARTAVQLLVDRIAGVPGAQHEVTAGFSLSVRESSGG